MLLHSTSRLPFGKYQGINLGLIYLLSPSYINWMLEDTPYYIGDIEFLQSLKVINRFGDRGPEAHHADVDVEEFRNNWHGRVDFDDVKFSGFEHFAFTWKALEKNREKVGRSSGRIFEKSITPEADRKIMIFYPGTCLNSAETDFTPYGVEVTKDDKSIVHFSVDNYYEAIKFLPYRNKLIVSSFFWPEWNMAPEELQTIFRVERPVKGQIIDGQLIIKK